MIEITVNSEFGDYTQKLNHGYKVNFGYVSDADFYRVAEGEWPACPCCGLTPMIWAFDNGRQTLCGCGDSRYDHFSVMAESVMSVYKRTGGTNMIDYDSDALRKNWNEYCATMINPCSHGDLIQEGKW